MNPRSDAEVLGPATRALLLVEGPDEVLVVRALGVPPHPAAAVRYTRGNTNLEREAKAASQDAHFREVQAAGVLIDADDDPHAALTLARRTLATLGGPDDLVHAEVRHVNGRRWGLFVIPGGAEPGALETLLRHATPNEAAWAGCADAWEACTAEERSPAPRDKAWLLVAAAAWPKVRKGWPQLLGQPGGIDLAHPAFAPLRAFLDRMQPPA